jgi:hypothetical protein
MIPLTKGEVVGRLEAAYIFFPPRWKEVESWGITYLSDEYFTSQSLEVVEVLYKYRGTGYYLQVNNLAGSLRYT